jgi:hypothetical protein
MVVAKRTALPPTKLAGKGVDDTRFETIDEPVEQTPHIQDGGNQDGDRKNEQNSPTNTVIGISHKSDKNRDGTLGPQPQLSPNEDTSYSRSVDEANHKINTTGLREQRPQSKAPPIMCSSKS